jgi:hypothetical protein
VLFNANLQEEGLADRRNSGNDDKDFATTTESNYDDSENKNSKANDDQNDFNDI